MAGYLMKKEDWIEMEALVIRAARPVLKRWTHRQRRRLRKRARRRQHQKRKQ